MSNEIPQSVIDQANYDIVGVIGKRIDLKKSGKNWMACCPFHKEKSPSFSVNEHKGFYYCFAGDTRVITWNGSQPISQLSGGSHRLLTAGGAWVDAPIKSFGVQPVWDLEISRGGITKIIRTTAEHRWFVKRVQGDVTTQSLKVGSYLESCLPAEAHCAPSAEGIRHGLVFGDGSIQHNCGAVNLHDDKIELSKHFLHTPKFHERGEGHAFARIYGGRSFEHMKALPSLGADNEYLSGFLAGYLASDGCVDKRGDVSLNSSNPSNLEFVRTICSRLGIGTGSICKTLRVGYLDEPGPTYRLNFFASTFPAELLLRSVHHDRFSANKRNSPSRARWKVLSVKPAGVSEEVFCAQVTGTHSFTLEDNILTGNCFGCGAGGDAVNFVVEYESLKFRDAVAAIVGNMPVNVTPEMVKQKAEALRVSYPAGNREDEDKCDEAAKRLHFADQHPWLAARNTAPYEMVADLGGVLIVPVERNGKRLNMAALLDDKVKWIAGGTTYGATHNILPVNLADPDNFIHDNEIILCLDYADAWRVWWLRGGRSIVLAAIDPDNFIWMQYQQKHVFTMVADYAEAIADLEERGHRTFTIPLAYQRKEKALG